MIFVMAIQFTSLRSSVPEVKFKLIIDDGLVSYSIVVYIAVQLFFESHFIRKLVPRMASLPTYYMDAFIQLLLNCSRFLI